ncbi:MAG TPA: DNA polymerase ligase N-terminal domain-containing protein [Gemmataceae bacterium]|nr:DNA polymerase ligase N-terminal domain-containing protein [Gemmataceae bacterium]
MSRYVILQHDHPFLHWDFMLEAGPALRTWRLASPPSVGVVIEATAIGDHRIAYLDYEGPLTGNRGAVVRWDFGEFEKMEQSEQRWVVRLHGMRLSGTATLERAADDWTLRFDAETT